MEQRQRRQQFSHTSQFKGEDGGGKTLQERTTGQYPSGTQMQNILKEMLASQIQQYVKCMCKRSLSQECKTALTSESQRMQFTT